jgi:uncharacterized protein (TIGR02147 family)
MRPEKPARISIFSYSDYRVFLKDAYEERRGMDPKFSHRFIAGKIGVSSSGWFTEVIKCRVNLAGTHLVKLAVLFLLENNETDYFECLVQYNQAASTEERNRYFKKLVSFKEMQVDLVGQEKFEFYSKWYYSALRELLFFHDFKGDYTALAKKLHPPIKASQAKEGIRLLELLGFIQKDAQGCFRPRTSTLKKDTSFRSLFTANYLKANMELGMDALERFPKEERHVSTMTLSYSRPGFQKALAELVAMRKRLVDLMDEDDHPDKAFQLNLQLFPITK